MEAAGLDTSEAAAKLRHWQGVQADFVSKTGFARQYEREDATKATPSLAKKVEEKFRNLDKPITIATMGCVVNGPGEAKHADFGIAGGIKEGYVFKKGEIVARVPEEQLLEKLEEIIIKSYK